MVSLFTALVSSSSAGASARPAERRSNNSLNQDAVGDNSKVDPIERTFGLEATHEPLVLFLGLRREIVRRSERFMTDEPHMTTSGILGSLPFWSTRHCFPQKSRSKM